MRAFRCPGCGAELVFENSVCLTCGRAVGYDRDRRAMVVVGAEQPICANLDRCGCNWVADPASTTGRCFNCRLTRIRPADGDAVGLRQYWVAESAKRRLVAELDELGLPVRVSDGYRGLAFDLLSSTHTPVTTGYHNGGITLDLAESDSAHRERLRESMAEPYRTVLGHLRHEIGHYYAELLALTTPRRSDFVAIFGDPTTSYDDALTRHYRFGPRPLWSDRYISAYATMHPLEDFAEVFAHFLHLADTLQTAATFGLVAGPVDLACTPMAEVVEQTWLPLTRALNQINRSMGQPDLYPFVLAPPVVAKLAFVADLVAPAP